MLFFHFIIRNMPKNTLFYNCECLRMSEFGFLLISRKVKVLELRVVLSANINMHIAVILSYLSSLYDVQKLRYGQNDLLTPYKGSLRSSKKNFTQPSAHGTYRPLISGVDYLSNIYGSRDIRVTKSVGSMYPYIYHYHFVLIYIQAWQDFFILS